MRTVLFSTAFATMLIAGTAAQQHLQSGATIQGELTAGDDQLDSGEFTDVYEVEGRAGQTLTVTLRSDDFDAYLMIGGPDGFDEQNDDAADGDANAALSVRLPADGTYSIFATSFGQGERGRYSLGASLSGGSDSGEARGPRTPSRDTPSEPSRQGPVQGTQPADAVAARLLEAHNVERRRVGAPPLTWSDSLEQASRVWARTLTANDQFEHDPNANAGENLWAGGGSRSFTPEEMVGSWIAERADYRPGVFPNVSRTGDGSDVGHYT